MSELRVRPAGDAALLVEWPARIDLETSSRVVSLARAIRTRSGALRDVVVGYCTVTVYYDPLVTDPAALEAEIRAIDASLAPAGSAASSLVEVPVRYGGEDGPDLDDVAVFAGCSPEDIVARHTSTTFRVYVVGFVPGFPYMYPLAGSESWMEIPRRSTPRTRVPAGSVAIAAGQTGIYPMETPGGWHLIGRTALKPYDPERVDRPFLFQAGDTVRFLRAER
jgi:KipI family sensor histidine kinase inhibitor